MSQNKQPVIPDIPDPDRTVLRSLLYQKYTALPSWQQSLLQLIALPPSATSQNAILSYAMDAGIRELPGQRLDKAVFNAAIAAFSGLHLINQASGYISVHPLIGISCERDAVALGVYQKYRIALGDSLFRFSDDNYYLYNDYYFDTSILHDTMITGSWKPLVKAYQAAITKPSLSIRCRAVVPKLFNNPFDPDLLIHLNPVVRDDIMRLVMHDAWRHLEPTHNQRMYLEKVIGQGKDPDGWCRYLLGMDDILHGRPVSIENTDKPDLLRAIECTISGEDADAQKLFTVAHKVLRTQTGCRSEAMPGFAGLFSLISQIRSHGIDTNPVAVTQIKSLLKTGYDPEWLRHFEIFDTLIDSSHNRSDSAPEPMIDTLLSRSVREKPLPDVYLSAALSDHWRQIGNLPQRCAILEKIVPLAETKGYLWLADQARSALDRMNGVPPAADPLQKKHWADAIKVVPRWERTLNALRTKVSAATSSANQDKRLRWEISIDRYNPQQPYQRESVRTNYSYTVREQKRSAKGKWSLGRELSGFLSSADLAAMGHLSHREKEALTWLKESRYSRWSSEPDITLLSLLAGLPNIFLNDDPDPVEIVKREPRLVVRQVKNEIHLTLDPFPDVAGNEQHIPGTLIMEDSNRLCVVPFTREQIDIARTLGPKGLRAPLEAQTSVMQTLATLSRVIPSHADTDGVDTGATPVEGSPRLHVQLSPSGDGLLIEICVRPVPDGSLHPAGRGGRTLFEFVGQERFQATRDMPREQAEIQALMQAAPTLADFADEHLSFVIPDTEIALAALCELKAMGDAITLLWPKGEWFDVSRMARLDQMKFRIGKDRDWFSVQGELALDNGQVVHLAQLLDLLDSTSSQFIRLDDKRFLALTQELRARLDRLRGATVSKGKSILMHPLMAMGLGDEFSDDPENISGDNHWREHLGNIRDGMVVSTPVPPGFTGELREYQEEGFAWMCRLAAIKAGACLADDMGLGKTVQAMALLLRRASGGPALVVAPTSVCMNWHIEAARFAPTLTVVEFSTSDREQAVHEAGPNTLVVCTYGLLQIESELICGKHWHTLILDEAQAIKNITAQRSRAAMELAADFRLATTGTPIENNLSELWNLFRFLNPGLLGSIEEFNRRFAAPIEQRKDKTARQQLRRIITPFILRRTKTQVLTELPPKTEIVKWVELSPREAAFHEALRQKALKVIASEDKPSHILVLTQITRLRRACCSPALIAPEIDLPPTKIAALGESLDELLANNHRALVFSQFVDHLAIIRAYLDKRGVSYQYLDGSTPTKDRQTRVAAFQSGEGSLFLISLKAGGLGLNLTGADFVIHMDPWWNPAVEDQATDRAHRMGQRRPVTVYRFICKGTIEEKIVALHGEKRDLAGGLLDGADISARMSVDELVGLISEDKYSSGVGGL